MWASKFREQQTWSLVVVRVVREGGAGPGSLSQLIGPLVLRSLQLYLLYDPVNKTS